LCSFFENNKKYSCRELLKIFIIIKRVSRKKIQIL
jgi:hypothetical protein